MPERDAQPEDALAVEMLGHHGQLVRLAVRITGDTHLGEDAVGNGYLKAWKARAKLQEPSKLLPWLRTICRREAYRLLQQVQQQPGRAG